MIKNTNAHIALVIRQISDIPIVALIEDENSRSILGKAGCTHILPVKALLGESLSNRTMAGGLKPSVVGNFDKNNVPYIISRQRRGCLQFRERHILKGDASKPGVLEAAGISNAPSVSITTNDDGINSYLTIYCRLLNKDICIISRANYDKNLNSLYKAGADFVVPYNMIGSNMVYNIIHQRNLILRTEGLSIFEYKVSRALDHKTLKKSNIRGFTQCNVICLRRNDKLDFDIKDSTILYQDDILFLIGTTDQEHKFFNIFGDKQRRTKKTRKI